MVSDFANWKIGCSVPSSAYLVLGCMESFNNFICSAELIYEKNMSPFSLHNGGLSQSSTDASISPLLMFSWLNDARFLDLCVQLADYWTSELLWKHTHGKFTEVLEDICSLLRIVIVTEYLGIRLLPLSSLDPMLANMTNVMEAFPMLELEYALLEHCSTEQAAELLKNGEMKWLSHQLKLLYDDCDSMPTLDQEEKALLYHVLCQVIVKGPQRAVNLIQSSGDILENSLVQLHRGPVDLRIHCCAFVLALLNRYDSNQFREVLLHLHDRLASSFCHLLAMKNNDLILCSLKCIHLLFSNTEKDSEINTRLLNSMVLHDAPSKLEYLDCHDNGDISSASAEILGRYFEESNV